MAATSDARRPASSPSTLREADVYLRSAIRPAARPRRAPARAARWRRWPAATTCASCWRCSFAADDPRVRFEAQRKIYLAKLLLDIDHSPPHPGRSAAPGLLRGTAAARRSGATRARSTSSSIGFHMDADGESIRYTSRPRPGRPAAGTSSRSSWRRRLAGRKIALDMLYYNCRFKRSVDPLSFEIVDGQHRVLERVRWGEMRQHTQRLDPLQDDPQGDQQPRRDRRPARRHVHRPRRGRPERPAHAARRRPRQPLRLAQRHRHPRPATTGRAASTATAAAATRSSRATSTSSSRPATPALPPYRFSVEIQIHTLESFLRTVCGAARGQPPGPEAAAVPVRAGAGALPAPRSTATDWLQLE